MDDDYDDQVAQIGRLSSMGSDDLINHLSNSNGPINSVAPNVFPHVQGLASRAIQFLGSKIPPSSSLLPEDRKMPISIAEKNRFKTYYDAVNNPVGVLDHVKNGTLSPLHVEALSSVYPELHQEMKSKIFEHLVDAKSKGQTLPYRLRNSVSTLLGQPLDSTQSQPMMAAITMANAPKGPPPAPIGKQKKVSKSTASTMEKSTALLQTPSQARQSGRLTS
jgi:hypothetical protein